ncbi:DUF2490 domain-containing protein [Novosphingobium sp. AP12]|uniref:DUF2490 domain-containing protein n=1 Tax=Novosphingobium sp. AP12 TaxID=1144305 RepID=UPI000271E228|nr:DUF2490 domain-containing protein [Novosphingobium sp. AP12]EJL33413.1 Protein of unknown function (DUF2490) [Novosphingobium sp. AP12]
MLEPLTGRRFRLRHGRFSWSWLVLLFGTVAGLAPESARAQQSEHGDSQVWIDPKVTVGLTDKLDFSAEALLELTDDASRTGLLLIRPTLTYRLTNRFSIGGGYTYLATDDHVGSDFHEHRIVEEATVLTTDDFNKPVLTLRTRLEERFREGEREMGLRVRGLARVDVPIGGSRRLVGWSEVFVGLNSTVWSGQSGPGQLISFAGVHLPLSGKLSVEPGYINQTIFDPGRNRVRHAFAVFLNAKL